MKVCVRPAAEQFKCLHVLEAIWSLSVMQAATIVNRPGRRRHQASFRRHAGEEGEWNGSERCTKEPKQKQKGEMIRWKCG